MELHLGLVAGVGPVVEGLALLHLHLALGGPPHLQRPAAATLTSLHPALHHFLPGICPGSVIDKGVLQQGKEDETDAHVGPDVDSLGVGNRRKAAVDAGGGGGHGQQCGDG